MASIERIIDDLNAAVPHHNRAIVRPEFIGVYRTASCFGRAALMGAALLEEGLPPDALSLLISEAHGMQKASGDHWFGHSELVVDTGSDAFLVLTSRTIEVGNLEATTWEPGIRAENQELITGVSFLPLPDSVQREAISYLPGFDEDSAIYEARDRYRAYPFEQGVLAYQSTHPDLNIGPAAQVADYVALYNRIVPSRF